MPDKSRTRIFLIIGGIAIAVIAVFLWRRASASEREVKTAPAPPVIEVSSAVAIAEDVQKTIETTGSFVAKEASDVAPNAAGRVVSTPVEVGDAVRKGQVVVKLDDSDVRLRLQQAQAQLEQAQAAVRQAQSKLGIGGSKEFEAGAVPESRAAHAAYESALAQAKFAEADARRYGDLVETGDVSQSNYQKYRTQAETAKAQANAAREQYEGALNAARQGFQGVQTNEASLSASRAQLALAQEALNDTVVRAPIDGFFSTRPVSPGEFVSTSSKVATIVQLQPIKLNLQLPQSNAGAIRVGMPVRASTSAFPDREFDGKITAINPAITPESRALTVEATFPNRDSSLKPGMFATARIVLPGTEKVVLVPAPAVQIEEDTNSSQVFVLDDGKARLKVVQAAKRENGKVRIISGLSGGKKIATSGLNQLYDGATIRQKGSGK